MRPLLGAGHEVELYWMTDRTPHESMPVLGPVARVVARQGRISVWYSQHNTPNPTGVLPDAPV